MVVFGVSLLNCCKSQLTFLLVVFAYYIPKLIYLCCSLLEQQIKLVHHQLGFPLKFFSGEERGELFQIFQTMRYFYCIFAHFFFINVAVGTNILWKGKMVFSGKWECSHPKPSSSIPSLSGKP